MARQYKRAYSLSIVPESGAARVISDLRINFEITKSILGYPNLAKITLYNANNDTLTALQDKFTKVTLDAGYEGNIRLIFKGEIRNVFQSKTGPDRLTVFYAGDGEKDWLNSSFNKTFAENVTTKSAIEEVIASFENTDTGSLEGLPEGADKLLGQTLSGSSKDILDMFAREYGFVWSIQDGEIITTPIEEPLSDADAVLVTSTTGMVGSPTLTEIGADVTTLLDARMLPNSSFKIESTLADVSLGNLFFRDLKKTNASGLYKVLEVVFKGDSFEGQWLSSVKGRSTGA